MNLLGLIVEYNPFHNGHKYHLEESIKLTNASHTIAVMSGNFVQRGEPALMDKWTRAKIAVDNGVNLVVELPLINSISSAENFALGSIELLDSIGLVNNIVFGSESDNIETIDKVASFLVNESHDYKILLQFFLDKGLSFPASRELALRKLGKIDNRLSSNDILGIEYVKAIKKLNSSINYSIIKRQHVDYHSTELVNSFSSATAIRNWIFNKDFLDVRTSVPVESYNYIENYSNFAFLNDFYDILRYSILLKSSNDLSDIYEISEGFENRIITAIKQSNTMGEFLDNIKTKRFTMTRIKRILMNILLDVTKSDVENFDLIHPKYIRVLAADKKGLEILRILNDNEDLSIITNLSKFKSDDQLLLKQLSYDLKSSDLYSLVKNEDLGKDYTQTPYIKK